MRDANDRSWPNADNHDRAVATISRLALLEGRPVAEPEINPLMVQAGGVVAVDGLVVLRKGA